MSFGMMPLSPDDKPDGFVLLSMYEKLESENAKLRNEVDNLLDFEHLTSVAVAYAGCDECGEYKQTMLRLFAENAKLRELLHEALLFGNERSYQEIMYRLKQQARELGVEVSE